jgi:hypothetical protein
VIHIVTLQRKPPRPMPEFVQAIENNSSYNWKVMSNVWAVDTSLSAKELYQMLREHIAPSDLLLVIRAQDDFSGVLTKDTWDWLRTSKKNGDFD